MPHNCSLSLVFEAACVIFFPHRICYCTWIGASCQNPSGDSSYRSNCSDSFCQQTQCFPTGMQAWNCYNKERVLTLVNLYATEKLRMDKLMRGRVHTLICLTCACETTLQSSCACILAGDVITVICPKILEQVVKLQTAEEMQRW